MGVTLSTELPRCIGAVVYKLEGGGEYRFSSNIAITRHFEVTVSPIKSVVYVAPGLEIVGKNGIHICMLSIRNMSGYPNIKYRKMDEIIKARTSDLLALYNEVWLRYPCTI